MIILENVSNIMKKKIDNELIHNQFYLKVKKNRRKRRF